jgi:hypothetical protein
VKTANVDGKILSTLKDWRDVEEKVVPGAQVPTDAAKEFYSKVLEFKTDGVPTAFLDEKPV